MAAAIASPDSDDTVLRQACHGASMTPGLKHELALLLTRMFLMIVTGAIYG